MRKTWGLIWPKPIRMCFCAFFSYSHSFRSLTLSLAGCTAGVLGLENVAGFVFFTLSVVFVNTILLLVNAKARPEMYFVLGSPPVITDASERLLPAKAAQLRTPPTPSKRALQLAQWVALQGAQENVLSFLLWWTFWYAIVHGTSLSASYQCMISGIHLATFLLLHSVGKQWRNEKGNLVVVISVAYRRLFT